MWFECLHIRFIVDRFLPYRATVCRFRRYHLVVHAEFCLPMLMAPEICKRQHNKQTLTMSSTKHFQMQEWQPSNSSFLTAWYRYPCLVGTKHFCLLQFQTGWESFWHFYANFGFLEHGLENIYVYIWEKDFVQMAPETNKKWLWAGTVTNSLCRFSRQAHSVSSCIDAHTLYAWVIIPCFERRLWKSCCWLTLWWCVIDARFSGCSSSPFWAVWRF